MAPVLYTFSHDVVIETRMDMTNYDINKKSFPYWQGHLEGGTCVISVPFTTTHALFQTRPLWHALEHEMQGHCALSHWTGSSLPYSFFIFPSQVFPSLCFSSILFSMDMFLSFPLSFLYFHNEDSTMNTINGRHRKYKIHPSLMSQKAVAKTNLTLLPKLSLSHTNLFEMGLKVRRKDWPCQF